MSLLGACDDFKAGASQVHCAQSWECRVAPDGVLGVKTDMFQKSTSNIKMEQLKIQASISLLFVSSACCKKECNFCEFFKISLF